MAEWVDEGDSTYTLTVGSLRAIGGPVAKTIAARADETARTASEGALVAVAEAAARWVGLSTEGER